ncbi:MAG: MBL fold metallo-hydrolase, partial [Planctomycetes bacterium]|nr:MBL fold metallo-hydrolase [Planctomycetota bacterium]
QIEEVAEKTYRLETPIPGVGLIFSVYIVDVDGGVLIEPGPTAAVPQIQKGMKQLGIDELSWIIPTHIHMDHAGGTGKLSELYPKAKVVAHPKSKKHIVDPSRLIKSTRKTYGSNFEEIFGPILPVAESRMIIPKDGEIIAISDREFQFMYAPGHAPHHIAIFDRSTGGLFCGEALGMATDDPLPAAAAPSFDLDDCIMTMEKLKALEPKVLCYSHGGVRQKPDKRISKAIDNTRVFGSIIRESLQKGESHQAIGKKIIDHASTRFPPEWGADMVKVWYIGALEGYITYYMKKGVA